ncbi:MAG: hypothetical protein DSY90_12350 [Deltaproteobacteria bacterium]|nr:MAG: hypothetical protein DSY90_12350 [Deltaproteobacteria bacterium]
MISSDTDDIKTTRGMNLQLIWGGILILAGLGVIYRIPEVIRKIQTIKQFSGNGIYFAYFSFCFIGLMLIGGGIKKIIYNIKMMKQDTSKRP